MNSEWTIDLINGNDYPTPKTRYLKLDDKSEIAKNVIDKLFVENCEIVNNSYPDEIYIGDLIFKKVLNESTCHRYYDNKYLCE